MTAPNTTMRLDSPEGLLAIVTVMLGFTPTDSIVVMYLAGSRLACTARLDLDQLHHASTVDMLMRPAASTGAERIAVVAYTDVVDEVLMEQVQDLVGDLELASGLTLAPLVTAVIGSTGWQDITDWVAGDGIALRPLDEILYHPIAAEAVSHGLRVGGDRADLVASVTPSTDVPEDFDELLLDATDLALRHPGEVAESMMNALLDELSDQEIELDAPTTAALAALAAQPATLRVVVDHLDAERAEAMLTIWSRVVRATSGRAALWPLVFAGLAAWVAGDGALLNVVVDRLAEIDPSFTMGRLLGGISMQALPPSRWAAIRTKLLAVE